MVVDACSIRLELRGKREQVQNESQPLTLFVSVEETIIYLYPEEMEPEKSWRLRRREEE